MPGKPKSFRAAHERAPPQAAQHYDHERGSARDRGYDARWSRARIAHLAAHPLCIGCLAVGRFVAATVVDHVEPHRGDLVKFWCEANWQPACEWHHNAIKRQLEGLFARGACALADLRLDSALAVARTLAALPASALGMGKGG